MLPRRWLAGILQRHEKAGPRLAVHSTADVTLAGRILGQQNSTRTESTNGAITDLDINRAGQVDHELAPRSIVKIQRVVTVYLSKNDPFTLPERRYPAHGTTMFEFDVQILEVRGAIISGINAYYLHRLKVLQHSGSLQK